MSPLLPHELCPPDVRKTLVDLRHDLHQHPELSFQETRTADRLYAALEELEPQDLRRLAGTGIIARIRGRDPSRPVVAIRGDIDALPIREETDVDYASVNDGVMHACGHDVHASWAVGAAHLLTSDPAPGDVVVLLQPAEETGRGAPSMIEAGALTGVSAIFGGHVDMRFPVGSVMAQAGPVSASADEFMIDLKGRGAHAARPHEGTDPVVASAHLITALQTIVSRHVAPGVPAVVSVGSIHGGTAPNVIPNTVRLQGTLRAVDPQTRKRLYDDVTRIAHGVAAAHGLEAVVELQDGTPPLVNDHVSAKCAKDAVIAILGNDALTTLPVPNLGGEDFACYLECVPGCFVRVGARGTTQEPVPAHSSKFLPSDDAIFVGSAVLAETARRASNALGQ